jgi:3-oxoadipate enol-lactonase
VSSLAQPHWPVVERGRGRPVVFLHGYPLNHSIFEPQLGALSARSRVVLLDLPGYGLAEEWTVPETLGEFAESVHRTLSRHLASPAVIVGHSFGGYVALELVRTHPELVEALVLADTRAEPDPPLVREERLALARRLEEPGERLEVEEVVGSLLSPASVAINGAIPNTVRRIVSEARSPAVVRTLRAIAHRPDLGPVLPNIGVPTMVVWGVQDRLIPPSQSRAMVERIPGSSGVGIAGAGHLPSLEAPETFNHALSEMMDHLGTHGGDSRVLA